MGPSTSSMIAPVPSSSQQQQQQQHVLSPINHPMSPPVGSQQHQRQQQQQQYGGMTSMGVDPYTGRPSSSAGQCFTNIFLSSIVSWIIECFSNGSVLKFINSLNFEWTIYFESKDEILFDLKHLVYFHSPGGSTMWAGNNTATYSGQTGANNFCKFILVQCIPGILYLILLMVTVCHVCNAVIFLMNLSKFSLEI